MVNALPTDDRHRGWAPFKSLGSDSSAIAARTGVDSQNSVCLEINNFRRLLNGTLRHDTASESARP